MNTAINLKGDTTDITASFALKANSLTVSNNQNSLTAAINLKGDKTDITTDLALKADSWTVSSNYNS